MPRIARCERRGKLSRERVVARAPRARDLEAVRDEDVPQPREGEHVHVLPRAAVCRRLTGMKGEWVADRADVGDVSERERLQPQNERTDVVPAGEILGAYECGATWDEDTASLGHEVIQARDVLDYLVRVDDVERAVREGPGLLEVGAANVEATRAGKCATLADELEPVNLLGRDAEPAAHLIRPRAVVATHVEQLRGRIPRERLEDLGAIRTLGLSPPTFHRASEPSTHPRERTR